jgi:hypothetical protein
MPKLEFTDEQNNSGVVYRRDEEADQQSKITNVVLKMGIVKTPQQANAVLFILCGLAIIASIMLFASGNNNAQENFIYTIPEEPIIEE